MRFLQSSWFPLLLGIIVLVTIINQIWVLPDAVKVNQDYRTPLTKTEWAPPDSVGIYSSASKELILYGRSLITNTAFYLGPKGIVAQLSNGMNCQNCHLDAGARNFANPFSAVQATYPRFSFRSGRKETIESRINDCMERSLNGQKLDSASREMRAMVAYVKWIGSEVQKGIRPAGAGTEALQPLARAADTTLGRAIFIQRCVQCHGVDGAGVRGADSVGFIYPPLWNNSSYNCSAGMFTLFKLAGFIKNNMPLGARHEASVLSTEEAWDVAAYIDSRPRPQKKFSADWPDISKKTIDYPFGPYADSFSEFQHKYGPFLPIQKARDESLAVAKSRKQKD